MARVRVLHADLMRPAREQAHAQQREAALLRDGLADEPRELAFGAHAHHAGVFVLQKIIREFHGRGDCAARHAQIGLLHRVRAERFG